MVQESERTTSTIGPGEKQRKAVSGGETGEDKEYGHGAVQEGNGKLPWLVSSKTVTVYCGASKKIFEITFMSLRSKHANLLRGTFPSKLLYYQ